MTITTITELRSWRKRTWKIIEIWKVFDALDRCLNEIERLQADIDRLHLEATHDAIERDLNT